MISLQGVLPLFSIYHYWFLLGFCYNPLNQFCFTFLLQASVFDFIIMYKTKTLYLFPYEFNQYFLASYH